MSYSDPKLVRLLKAISRVLDRHAEIKRGPGVVELPVAPRELKELRAAIEPFRDLMRQAEIESRPLATTIVSASVLAGAPITSSTAEPA